MTFRNTTSREKWILAACKEVVICWFVYTPVSKITLNGRRAPRRDWSPLVAHYVISLTTTFSQLSHSVFLRRPMTPETAGDISHRMRHSFDPVRIVRVWSSTEHQLQVLWHCRELGTAPTVLQRVLRPGKTIHIRLWPGVLQPCDYVSLHFTHPVSNDAAKGLSINHVAQWRHEYLLRGNFAARVLRCCRIARYSWRHWVTWFMDGP